MEELNRRIESSDLSDENIVSNLFEEINAIENEEERNQLFGLFFTNVHKYILNESVDNLLELDGISSLKDRYVIYTGLSLNEINLYFENYEIVSDKIMGLVL